MIVPHDLIAFGTPARTVCTMAFYLTVLQAGQHMCFLPGSCALGCRVTRRETETDRLLQICCQGP